MNQRENISNSLMEHASSLMNQKLQIEKIETVLIEKGHDAESIKSVLAILKKDKHKKDLSRGLSLLIIGGLILLISFIITVYFFHANISLEFFMYISSGIGISFCFLGFKKIFG